MLSTTAPKFYKFVNSAIGVELWRQGTSHAMFKLLQRIGITQSVAAARSYVDAHPKHQSSENHNRFLMMVLCYSVQHCIPSLHLTDPMLLQACKLPATTFLPTVNDYESFLRSRLELMVQRILVTNLAWLKALKTKVAWHLQHEHSKEMNSPSRVGL